MNCNDKKYTKKAIIEYYTKYMLEKQKLEFFREFIITILLAMQLVKRKKSLSSFSKIFYFIMYQ